MDFAGRVQLSNHAEVIRQKRPSGLPREQPPDTEGTEVAPLRAPTHISVTHELLGKHEAGSVRAECPMKPLRAVRSCMEGFGDAG